MGPGVPVVMPPSVQMDPRLLLLLLLLLPPAPPPAALVPLLFGSLIFGFRGPRSCCTAVVRTSDGAGSRSEEKIDFGYRVWLVGRTGEWLVVCLSWSHFHSDSGTSTPASCVSVLLVVVRPGTRGRESQQVEHLICSLAFAEEAEKRAARDAAPIDGLHSTQPLVPCVSPPPTSEH